MPTKTRKKTATAEPAVPAAAAKPATPRRAARKSAVPAEPIGPMALPTPAGEEASPARAARRKAAAKPAASTGTAPLPASGPNAVASDAAAIAPMPAAADTARAPVLRPLAALGVEEGVFVLVAASAAFEAVEAFARYVEEPLPHLAPVDKGAWLSKQTVGSAVVYAAYVPWPRPSTGLVKLGCITTAGRKPVFSVECLRWGEAEPARLAALLKRYGMLLVPALKAMLPVSHPLRMSLSPGQGDSAKAPSPALVEPRLVVKGNFDGVVDEQVHGWAWCPSKPNQRLTVEVLCGDEVVGRGAADRFREDLEANGIGDGQHHFRLTLSSELFDGQPHELSVRVAETGAVLPGRARTTLMQRQPSPIDLMPRMEVLALARELAAKAQVRDAKALQALLQALRTASLQQETGQFASARAGYERLLKVLGTNALCHVRIGETWLLENDLAQARTAYDAAVQADAEFAWAHLGLGNVFRLQGRPLEAEAAYQAALACAPGLPCAMARHVQVQGAATALRARHLAQQGDRSGAVLLLASVLVEQPDHAEVMQGLDEVLGEPELTGGATLRMQLSESVTSAIRARRLLDVVMDEAERRLSAATCP